MTTTIARQARIRFADQTAPLAQVVINTRDAVREESLVEDLIADIEAYLGDEEFEFDCGMCGEGVHEVFTRLTEDFEEVEACERCVIEYRLGYAAE